MPSPTRITKTSKMRAQLLTAAGGPENFALTKIDRPEPGPGTVLVRLAATSINQIDVKIRTGLPIGPAFPAILGADIAGTVEALGQDVTDFKVGDEVYGCAGGVRGLAGTLAEYIVADVKLLAPKPRSLSMRETAALPLVSITAWEAIERTGLAANELVLIHGGVGGVGHIAIQLAKAKGARVATTIPNGEATDLARSLGADETIIYTEEGVQTYVDRLTSGLGFDVVIDTVGNANLDKSLAAASLNGRIAATATRSTHDLSPMHSKGLSLHVIFMLIPMLHGIGREQHGRILRELAALVDRGEVRPLIDPQLFTLDTAADAHRRLESGRAIGKVIVDII